MEALWDSRHHTHNLLGSVINVSNGQWLKKGSTNTIIIEIIIILTTLSLFLLTILSSSSFTSLFPSLPPPSLSLSPFLFLLLESGVGAGIDSYYEYCLKSYILLGDREYLRRFNAVSGTSLNLQ